MSRTKEASKRKIWRKAVPVLSVAGVSLAMAGTASATANEPATDTWSQNTSPHHEIFLGEEEISDVSLATLPPLLDSAHFAIALTDARRHGRA